MKPDESPEQDLLGGRVVVRSLPVLGQRPNAGGPSLKRLMLPQGELAQFYDSDAPIRYLAFVELRPGCARGNHYHKVKEEHIYLIAGDLELRAYDVDTGTRCAVTLHAGDYAVIRPWVAHRLEPLVPGQAIEFSPVRFDPTDSFSFSPSR